MANKKPLRPSRRPPQTRAQVRKQAQRAGKNPNPTPLEKKLAKGAGFVLKHGVPLATHGLGGYAQRKATEKAIDYFVNNRRKRGKQSR